MVPSRPVERDLSGRCGGCAFFLRTHTDPEGRLFGACRLGCWPSPVRDDATCGSHTPRGAPTDQLARKVRTPRGGGPRRRIDREPREPRLPLPREIDIDMDQQEFRRVLTEVLREELGVGEVEIGERWRGGELVLAPGRDDTQDKRFPIEVFFKKIVMIRDKLRVLEAKVNASSLPEDEKVQLQQYVTACYGSLTTFNVLFAEREERFVGASGKG